MARRAKQLTAEQKYQPRQNGVDPTRLKPTPTTRNLNASRPAPPKRGGANRYQPLCPSLRWRANSHSDKQPQKAPSTDGPQVFVCRCARPHHQATKCHLARHCVPHATACMAETSSKPTTTYATLAKLLTKSEHGTPTCTPYAKRTTYCVYGGNLQHKDDGASRRRIS